MNQMQQPNPQQMLYNQFMSRVQVDPTAQRVYSMCQGKTPQELATVFQNLGKNAGMNREQMNQFLSQYGLNL